MATQRVPFGVNEQFGASEVLQMLCLGGRTGTLRMSNTKTTVRLLILRGRVTRGDFDAALDDDAIKQLPPESQVRLLRADIQRVLVEVLGWDAGTATFDAEEPAGDAVHQFDLDSLLIDAIRSIDEWKQAADTIPALSAVLVQASGLTERQIENLPPLARSIVKCSNGRTTLGEVALRLHAPDLEVARTARALLDDNVLLQLHAAFNLPDILVHDQRIEETLTRAIVELQSRLAVSTGQRSTDRRTQQLIAVLLDSLTVFTFHVIAHAGSNPDPTLAWLRESLRVFQQRYEALELLSFSENKFHSGDIIAAYVALGGAAREQFYAQVACSLYAFITAIAVHIVDDQLLSRQVAERVRSTIAAYFLELEAAIQSNITAGPGVIDPDWAAARREHFRLIA